MAGVGTAASNLPPAYPPLAPVEAVLNQTVEQLKAVVRLTAREQIDEAVLHRIAVQVVKRLSLQRGQPLVSVIQQIEQEYEAERRGVQTAPLAYYGDPYATRSSPLPQRFGYAELPQPTYPASHSQPLQSAQPATYAAPQPVQPQPAPAHPTPPAPASGQQPAAGAQQESKRSEAYVALLQIASIAARLSKAFEPDPALPSDAALADLLGSWAPEVPVRPAAAQAQPQPQPQASAAAAALPPSPYAKPPLPPSKSVRIVEAAPQAAYPASYSQPPAASQPAAPSSYRQATPPPANPPPAPAYSQPASQPQAAPPYTAQPGALAAPPDYSVQPIYAHVYLPQHPPVPQTFPAPAPPPAPVPLYYSLPTTGGGGGPYPSPAAAASAVQAYSPTSQPARSRSLSPQRVRSVGDAAGGVEVDLSNFNLADLAPAPLAPASAPRAADEDPLARFYRIAGLPDAREAAPRDPLEAWRRGYRERERAASPSGGFRYDRTDDEAAALAARRYRDEYEATDEDEAGLGGYIDPPLPRRSRSPARRSTDTVRVNSRSPPRRPFHAARRSHSRSPTRRPAPRTIPSDEFERGLYGAPLY